MGDESFSETLLTEKLSKLNGSQQGIESVSRWCISHRKKAKQVVVTWEKLFESAQRQQKILFLYLSSDILQNSRRKGSEFVNEFWKVLPAALKGVYDGGSEGCRRVVSRLVDILEQRKVFGSKGQNLKNEVLGAKNPSPVNVVKNLNPNPMKVLKRDSTSLRIKLAVGGSAEKILSAMLLVNDRVASEEAVISKCRDAVSWVREIEKDVANASSSSQGNPEGSDVIDNIQKQENTIQQCISELEKSEEIRVALVCQLREAIEDQESKLEQIRSELLVARVRIEKKGADVKAHHDPTFPPGMPPPTTTTTTLPTFSPATDEESKKATAAAMAAKLTASTSSAQMLTSILSSLVAEEAASMSTGLKRPKIDPERGGEPNSSAYFSNPHQMFANMPAGTSQLQIPFMPPPPPPAPATSQFGQIATGMSYGYGGMAFGQPGPPPQQPASGGYFRPVGVGFYGQPPTTPPMHHQ